MIPTLRLETGETSGAGISKIYEYTATNNTYTQDPNYPHVYVRTGTNPNDIATYGVAHSSDITNTKDRLRLNVFNGTTTEAVGLAEYSQGLFTYDVATYNKPEPTADFYWKETNDYFYNFTDNWDTVSDTSKEYVALNSIQTKTYNVCYTYDYNTTTTANAMTTTSLLFNVKTDHMPFTLSREYTESVMDNSITVSFATDNHCFDSVGSTHYINWDRTGTSTAYKIWTSDSVINSDLITAPWMNFTVSESLTAGTYEKTYTRLWSEPLNKGEVLTCEWHTNVATTKPSSFSIKFSQSFSDANYNFNKTDYSLTIDELGNIIDYATAESPNSAYITKSRTTQLYYGYSTRYDYTSSVQYNYSNIQTKTIKQIVQTLPFGITSTTHQFSSLKLGGNDKEYTTLTIMSNYSDAGSIQSDVAIGMPMECRLYYSTNDSGHNRICFLTNASYGNMDASVGNRLQDRSESMAYWVSLSNNTTTYTGYFPQRYYEQYAINFTNTYNYLFDITKYSAGNAFWWSPAAMRANSANWANQTGPNNDVIATSTVFNSLTDGLYVLSLQYGQQNKNYPWGLFIDCGTSTFASIGVTLTKVESWTENNIQVNVRQPSWENREVSYENRNFTNWNYLYLGTSVNPGSTSAYSSNIYGFTLADYRYGTLNKIGNITTTTKVYSCTENKYATTQTTYTSKQDNINYNLTGSSSLYIKSNSPVDLASSREVVNGQTNTTYDYCNNVGYSMTIPYTITETGSLYHCGTFDDGYGNFATGLLCNSAFNEYTTVSVMTKMNIVSTADNNKFAIGFGIDINGRRAEDVITVNKSDWQGDKAISDICSFTIDPFISQDISTVSSTIKAWLDKNDIFMTKSLSDVDINIPELPSAVSYTIPSEYDFNNEDVQWKEGTANVYYARGVDYVREKTWSGNIKYVTYSKTTVTI